MNLVQTITDQALSGGFGKLTSLLGGNEAKTQSAVGAAVPALLSGFSSLASTGEGVRSSPQPWVNSMLGRWKVWAHALLRSPKLRPIKAVLC